MEYFPPLDMLKKNGYYINSKIPSILKDDIWKRKIAPAIIEEFNLKLFKDVYYNNTCKTTLNGENRKKLRIEEIKFLQIYFAYNSFSKLSRDLSMTLNQKELRLIYSFLSDKNITK